MDTETPSYGYSADKDRHLKRDGAGSKARSVACSGWSRRTSTASTS